LIYVPMYAYIFDAKNKKTNPIEKIEEVVEG